MSLVTDANPDMGVPADIAKKNIKLDILQKIEDDLDIDDIIAILFLMLVDYKNSFHKIFKLYCEAKKNKISVIAELVKDNLKDWEDKLLECICICDHRKIVKTLGLRFEDLEIKYIPKNRRFTRQLNPIAKCLYFLCESLTMEETKRLLRLVKEDRKEYERLLEDIDHLELHLLYWLNIGYISIFSVKQANLKNLLKHLKTFDSVELIVFDLEQYNCDQEIENAYIHEEACSLERSSLTNVDATNDAKKNLRKLKKGLCIIINQVHFPSASQYETRYGTSEDCNKLCETFKGFGFAVKVFKDLDSHNMLSKIRNLSNEYGSDYDCVFLCILSHGCRESVIASDEVEVSIKDIDDAFCHPKFSEVIKIVIIQACQGKILGKVADRCYLTSDGPNDPAHNVIARTNFCIFMSTVQGFAAVRDKQRGSWFIQELCKVLRESEGRKFLDCISDVISAVQSKRAVMDGEIVAQVPELHLYRLTTDFELPRYNPRTNEMKICPI